MNLAWRLIRFALHSFFLREAEKKIRRQGVLLYLKTLRTVRLGLLGAIALFAVFQLMVLGLIGAIVTGVLLAPLETETRLWILFGGFAALFVIPFVGLLVLFSERVWFKASGARDMAIAAQLPRQ